mmetsp:Transcript_10158/g.30033  ORF Transcript_10158/g.30033 Transcript_10158/m.30033 type:complete len:262 (-) Transcript_10158:2381-3166(-)
MGRVRAQEAGGDRAEPAPDTRGPRGLVGPRHPAHQHPVPEGPAHAGLRQGLAHAPGIQAVPAHEEQHLLVDAPAPRRQAVEPQQLPHRHDPGSRRRGGHPRAHPVQGHVLPHVGGPFLGEGLGIRGEHEVQEAHQRAAVGTQPDSQPPLHALVVAHNQPRKRVRGLPGAARPHGHLHAWQDPHAQDLAHPDFPRPPVAEDPRVRRHGPLPGARRGARCARDRDGAEGDHPPAQVLQDELVVCRHPPLRRLQVAGLQAFAPR